MLFSRAYLCFQYTLWFYAFQLDFRDTQIQPVLRGNATQDTPSRVGFLKEICTSGHPIQSLLRALHAGHPLTWVSCKKFVRHDIQASLSCVEISRRTPPNVGFLKENVSQDTRSRVCCSILYSGPVLSGSTLGYVLVSILHRGSMLFSSTLGPDACLYSIQWFCACSVRLEGMC